MNHIKLFRFIGTFALLVTFITANAQETVVFGKVIDAKTGEPVPFANIVFKGTDSGTTTDFDGQYRLETDDQVDSITASYVGYTTKTKQVKPGMTQRIDYQLIEDVLSLQEVIFIAGENPAFEIMRKVIAHKDNNDKRSLEAYQYQTYTKIEIDIDNISEKFRQKKVMQKITTVVDSLERLSGEDGKPLLPIFLSESLSEYYYRSNPKLRHEKILKTKITGVGIEDGTLVSQFIGSSFQEYNFYQNWLNIVNKEFISPLADSWKLYYEYDLTDSAYVGEHFCYRLDFFPKSEQDLAFSGVMWITKEDYALKQIDANVSSSANLNYVEKIKIQQELVRTGAGAWMPAKNRILLDIGDVTAGMAGFLAKFYTSNRNIQVNRPREINFYDIPIEVAEDFKVVNDTSFWNRHRHEPLSPTEVSVYKMIDTLRNIPVIKTYAEILKVAITGYKKIGNLDAGPYLSLYANNSVEGHRFQLGGKTNIDFSNRWVFGGWVGYGTADQEFKFRGFAKLIADREKWTVMQLAYTKDIDQVGLAADDLVDNYIFFTATKFGDLIRPYRYDQAKFSLQREVFKGYRQKATFQYRTFDPLFNFGYSISPEATDSPVGSNFQTSEVVLEARYAKDELFVQNDNERISLGTRKWPVITLRYTRGFKGVLDSDFNYNKIGFSITNDMKMGFFGTSSFSLTGEHVFETLPYPLLKAHIGNESLFYTTAAFNMMNYSEFVSDSYAYLKYNHYFQGFLLNRVPLMKKLKWRLVATANVLYGRLKEENKAIIPEYTKAGERIEPVGFFTRGIPYIEVGYGIENILKVIRVDFIHRLTYLNRPDADKFGVKVSFQFIL